MNCHFLNTYDSYRRIETPEEKLKKLKNMLKGMEKRLVELPKEIEKLQNQIAKMEAK